jgi:plastocyanin
MLRINLLSLFIMVLLFIVPVKSTTHNVDVGDFFFDAVSFTAAVGDTIVWTLIAGTHTTTSTLVPAGAATWDYTFSGPSDTFSYIITVPGVYEYICSFHPLLMIGSFATPAALPYFEDFEYPTGDLLAYHGWVNHSGSGSFVTVFTGSLTYPGYPGSGLGNHINLEGGSGSREDIHRAFESVSTGNLYAAFLVNVSSSDVNDGYVAHFMPPPGNFNYRGRLFMMDDGAGNLKFGISKGSSSVVSWAPANYVYSQTYLIVIKYEYVGDATGDDDVAKLWVNPDLSSPEPANGDADNIDTIGDEVLERFAIRQGSEAHIYEFDGLTVSINWSELIPVELVSFNASVNENTVSLSWATATELNNSGFEVLRSSEAEVWEKIAFVPGNGTTTETQYYSFEDQNLSSGKYSYKLKQIDFDGSYEYSNEVYVDVTNPVAFELSQNYPNPFNPSTTIKFAIPEATLVTLKVFNALGEEVALLVDGFMESGIHEVNFDAFRLNSGMYFYRIQAGDFTQVKKMTFLK